VLGAGASAPYGFPLGEQLVERIKTLKDPDIQGFLKRAPDFTTDHVIQFQTDLKTSGWRSIDSPALQFSIFHFANLNVCFSEQRPFRAEENHENDGRLTANAVEKVGFGSATKFA